MIAIGVDGGYMGPGPGCPLWTRRPQRQAGMALAHRLGQTPASCETYDLTPADANPADKRPEKPQRHR